MKWFTNFMAECTRHRHKPLSIDWRISAAIYTLLPILILAIPRSAPIVFFLIASFSLIHLLSRGNIWSKETIQTPIVIAFLALGTYCLLNAAWSVNPQEAYGKASLFSLILASVYLIQRAIDGQSPTTTTLITRALIAGFIIGLLYIFFEFLTDQSIKRALYNLAPGTRPPSTKHIHMDGNNIASVATYVLNRNVGFLMLALWPILLMISVSQTWRSRNHLLTTLLIATVFVVFSSRHESSYIACILSLGIFLMAKLQLRTVLWGMATMWAAAFILALPLALLAYKAELHHAKWLPNSSRARIVLWKYTAEQIVKAPILGVGIRSTKTLNANHKNVRIFVTEKGVHLPQETGRHAHNLYLQTWYELGLIGVLLILAAGLTIIHWISRRARQVQPFALATFTTFATIAAFSWGIWQTWYMCGIALTVVTLIFAEQYARDNRK